MSYLLDTQALIFFFENDLRLSPKAKALIEDPQNQIFVSIASLWEIAIKISIGKLHPTQPLKKFFERIPQEAMDLMNLSESHILAVSAIPLHHRDPFDRLIIAQAIVEKLEIISNDVAFDAYPVKRVW